MSPPIVAKVTPSLEPLLVPIDSIHPHPENPNEGDPAGIAASLAKYGQYIPVVVQRATGMIIKGEHTWEAARLNGWTHVAANLVDYDATEAVGVLAGDNRHSEKSHRDPDKLGALLARYHEEAGDLFGTGYDDLDLAALLGQGDPLADAADDAPTLTVYGQPGGVPVGTARVIHQATPATAQPFSPNLQPNPHAADITSDHIARAQADLAQRFAPTVPTQIAVTCPHCAELFYIDKDEKGHIPR